MRKSYIDTVHGQVHLRDEGRGRPLLAIHWTPLSGRMFECVAPAFAARGWRVIAPDLLGYGRSDPRPERWSIEAWADTQVEVLDALGIQAASVLGGHIGASVAAEFALRHPARVERLVLDGCPLPTPELRAALRGLAGLGRPRAAGAERIAWDRAVGLLKDYIRGFEVGDESLDRIWPVMVDYLSTDFMSSGQIAAEHDLSVRLPLIAGRTLLLGAELDPLAGSFEPARAPLTPAAAHLFPGQHPLHYAERAEEYAAVVADFLEAA